MNNRLKIIFFLSFAIYLSSCQKDNVEAEINLDTKYLLSVEKARNIAVNINLSDPYNSTKGVSNLKIEGNEIIEETTINLDNNPAFHVFNFSEDEGFAIISADLRAIPILAYSDKGNFIQKSDPINAGLASYLEEYYYYIESVRASKAPMTRDINRMWKDVNAGVYLIEPCDDDYMKCDDGGGDGGGGDGGGGGDPFVPTTQTWGPLVSTAWSQKEEYRIGWLVDEQCWAATGCVATAMAQIINYWEYPNNYNWGNMYDGDAASYETGRLMYDCGVAVDMDWGCTVSSASSGKAFRKLKSDFGYSNDAGYTEYLYYKARNDIKAGKPVYIRACREREKKGFIITWYVYDGCHAWVTDGVKITNYETYSTSQIHMNWGWGKFGGNGWYTTWQRGTRNYQYKKKMIHNLHP